MSCCFQSALLLFSISFTSSVDVMQPGQAKLPLILPPYVTKLQGKSMYMCFTNKNYIPANRCCFRAFHVQQEIKRMPCNCLYLVRIPLSSSVIWVLDDFGAGNTRNARVLNANNTNKPNKLKLWKKYAKNPTKLIVYLEPSKLWRCSDQINLFLHLLHK